MVNSAQAANGSAPFGSARPSQIGDRPQGYEAVHVASLAEKKRLWWTNAFINLFFIAGWYALRNVNKRICKHFHRFFFATLLSLYNKWMF